MIIIVQKSTEWPTITDTAELNSIRPLLAGTLRATPGSITTAKPSWENVFCSPGGLLPRRRIGGGLHARRVCQLMPCRSQGMRRASAGLVFNWYCIVHVHVCVCKFAPSSSRYVYMPVRAPICR